MTYDVAIIGAGVIGSALFRELGKYRLSTALIEKENDVTAYMTDYETDRSGSDESGDE